MEDKKHVTIAEIRKAIGKSFDLPHRNYFCPRCNAPLTKYWIMLDTARFTCDNCVLDGPVLALVKEQGVHRAS